MGVKIFLPKEFFYLKRSCKLYGKIQINGSNISLFVLNVNDTDVTKNQICHLGQITAEGSMNDSKDVPLNFTYSIDSPTICLSSLNIRMSNAIEFGNLFLYDCEKIRLLHWSDINAEKKCDEAEQSEDIRTLYELLSQTKIRRLSQNSKNSIILIFNYVFADILSLIEIKPLVFLIQKTSLYEHYIEWKQVKSAGKRIANMCLDKLLGLLVMVVLLLCINRPGDYLIQASQYIIEQFRMLLVSLKGSPIGLKLNVHLNNFLLDCFSYHIDLWATFLNIIEQVVRQVFVPIAILGIMGLSFQLAMLSDLISLIGLHAHCCYIYTSILYKIEIKGLQVLWKVVLGKRKNRLKERDESHNYMNRQLFLATMFFTSLLFLFPTILVYYVVFTTLRLCIYSVKSFLKIIRRQLLEFPLNLLFKWMIGRFCEIDSLHVQYKSVAFPSAKMIKNEMELSVFDINVKSSSLPRVFSCESGILKELTANDNSLSVKNIFHRILHGQF